MTHEIATRPLPFRSWTERYRACPHTFIPRWLETARIPEVTRVGDVVVATPRDELRRIVAEQLVRQAAELDETRRIDRGIREGREARRAHRLTKSAA